eukprot:CAMPEP_0119043752 /NCGR_PEP_ID=MMETSP1177-20130426/25498_1 /TAXON_ID=2985 /ORGANISM="Ochromonas sp, Strain CCMP1899" /LENGTH=266 /DNA_ID=CAMNT_0007012545 /DNA_START=217 /DNA_END=1017 /DNA_ORIENTATION=+
MSEIRDIYKNKISTDHPFNSTNDEIGIRLAPMKGNLLEFHFSFTGIEGTSYSGGIYHGRILLHPDYPRKAPAISVLTPTGRWECGKDICLSASSHHQETWDPNWNLRTIVMALRGHILTQPREIGGILTTVEHQQKLALSSRDWSCPICGIQHAALVPGAKLPNIRSPVDEGTILPRGYKVEIGQDGIIDVQKVVSLAESKGLKGLKIKKVMHAKMLKQKRNRMKFFRHLFLSIFVSFSFLMFQFWSLSSQSAIGGGVDSKKNFVW